MPVAKGMHLDTGEHTELNGILLPRLMIVEVAKPDVR